MVHIKLCDDLFEVDLTSPTTPARWWFVGGWANHALTNEEVLFDPAAAAGPSSEEIEGAAAAFAGPSSGPDRDGKVPGRSGANDP